MNSLSVRSLKAVVAGAVSALILPVAIPSACAQEAPRTVFDIPSGPLSQSIVLLGRQARIAIILSDGQAGNVRTSRLRGQLRPEEALRRLLAGTGFTFRRLGSGDFLIVRAPRQVAPARTALRPATRDEETEATVVITASKTGAALATYPGSVAIIDLASRVATTRPGQGTELIVDQLPVLASTSLGPGRNKLFARAVSDSSYNGPSEANVGQYFGDLRLTYGGPDPDLDLFDVEKVEVLTGPYGTLYGTGALGGVIRIEPARPDPDRMATRMETAIVDVRHGGTEASGTAMLNLPLVTERAALRLVGYRRTQPGYIDNPRRGERDVNRVTKTGMRVSLLLKPGEESTVEAGIILQGISGRSSQYTTDANALVIRTPIAEPFSSDYLLSSLAYRAAWGNWSFSSTFGFSRQQTDDLFYVLANFAVSRRKRSLLFSNETRIAGDIGGTRIVTGGSFIASRSSDRVVDLFSGVPDFTFFQKQTIVDLALFGEASVPLSETLSATVGARLNHIRSSAQLAQPGSEPPEPGHQSGVNLLPTLALSWRPVPGLQLYASYRTGSRSGNSFRSDDTTAVSKPDHLTSLETGFRFSPTPSFRLSGAISRSHWKNMQVDLLNAAGNALAVNLGKAEVWGVEARVHWRPVPALSLDAAMFMNNGPVLVPSDSAKADSSALLSESLRLPVVSKLTGRAQAMFQTSLFDGVQLRLATALRYYGASHAELDRRQPAYVETAVDASLDFGRWRGFLTVTNLLDSSANRFGLANYGRNVVFRELQFTPLQPRTATIGLEVNF